MEQIFALKGMHCQSCVKKVETGIAPYAAKVQASLGEARLYVTDLKIPFEELKADIARLGDYELLLETTTPTPQTASKLKAYYPLILIVGYLAVVSMAGVQGVSEWMRHFMGGFFLAFSFFKLLNIEKFATSYASYDLLAMRWKTYGFIYPFCELGLGLAYLFNWQTNLTLWVTIILIAFSTIGVLSSMCRKQDIRCACLGDLMNVPLSTVTLAEDIGMGVMAAAMLALK
jgi:copper chaperone CopZ